MLPKQMANHSQLVERPKLPKQNALPIVQLRAQIITMIYEKSDPGENRKLREEQDNKRNH